MILRMTFVELVAEGWLCLRGGRSSLCLCCHVSGAAHPPVLQAAQLRAFLLRVGFQSCPSGWSWWCKGGLFNNDQTRSNFCMKVLKERRMHKDCLGKVRLSVFSAVRSGLQPVLGCVMAGASQAVTVGHISQVQDGFLWLLYPVPTHKLGTGN